MKRPPTVPTQGSNLGRPSSLWRVWTRGIGHLGKGGTTHQRTPRQTPLPYPRCHSWGKDRGLDLGTGQGGGQVLPPLLPPDVPEVSACIPWYPSQSYLAPRA